jgi:DNA-directed RNA polymerase specialized sigma24 family protein
MADELRSYRFPTTRWSRVVAAGDRFAPDARQALSDLCTDYWYPLYAFVRRKGYSSDQALDLTQEYFGRLLARGTVAAADPGKGRFRSFLLADCTHFLSHRRQSDQAQKRGGGALPLSIDARDAEGRFVHEPAHNLTAERVFERDWANALLESVLARLRREYHDSGRGTLFDTLKFVLSEDPRAVPQAEMAERLGMKAGAVQVAVHRMRNRYRAMVREAIAATVTDPADIEAELRDLFAALGS